MSVLRTVTTTVFCLALMGAVFSPAAKADEWNRKTVITFSGPVEIPGVHLKGWGVLPAGTYVFKILDSQATAISSRFSTRTKPSVFATILAIPNYRLKATDKTVVTFRERPAGEPEALRAWFYPGRNWGEEFVYPKARAMELAKTDQHAGPLHGGRTPGGSRRADPDGGPPGGRATEAGARHGGSTHGRRGGSRPGGHPAARWR